jgi:hypothetical protein
MRRRTFLAAAAGACVAGAGAIYAPLVLGDDFESHVADRIGVDVALATALMTSARERLGALEYDARSAAFAAATRRPLAGLVPDGARRTAVRAYLRALLAEPPARLAYALGREPVAACGGLVRVT